ncbi:MAG: hypothetical protein Q9222_004156 [Ikaeria aurantiellina]
MSHQRDRSPRSPPLPPDSSTFSDYTTDSTSTYVDTPGLTPGSPIHHRAGYSRVASFNDQDSAYYGPDGAFDQRKSSEGQGLGIKNSNPLPSASPTGKRSRGASILNDVLLSPPSSQVRKGHVGMEKPILEGHEGWKEDDISKPEPHEAFVAGPETESLHKQAATLTKQSNGPQEPWCKAKTKLHRSKGSRLAISIVALSVYSTILSGLWLGVSIKKPHYDHWISNTGRLPPAAASSLANVIAKTIEVSFATVLVTFVGQVLSRRALVERSRGITIAEMATKSWILQPGTIFSQWKNVRYAGLTFLGAIALLSTFSGMFYTTASNALVAPQLKIRDDEHRVLYGKVAASFANEPYIQQNCQTPISEQADPSSGLTCIAVEHSGQAYHNFMQYLSNWTTSIARGTGSDDLRQRPIPVGMLYDNTTIRGSWINVENMTETSQKYSTDGYGRIVTNVTMAMPHAGVFAASRDPFNDILQPQGGIYQPQDLNGFGEYEIKASVPSPVTNVLCASMRAEELAPMVYSLWPNGNDTQINVPGWPKDFDIPLWPDYLNQTSVDDLFGFGAKYSRRHPVFPKLPLPYNTVMNYTGPYADSIYLLAASANQEYTMCSLRASITTKCSTHYHASSSGGSMDAHCEDDNDMLAYHRSNETAPEGAIQRDWATVATEWASSLSLMAGITDGMSSNARLLTQLIPTSQALDPSLPSIAEALAVLSGFTLEEPQYEGFNASLRIRDYASGGTKPWQGFFYVVLSLTFAINLFCLFYFLARRGLVTDFIEPQNLFALSLNSPPSQAMDGACGGGPVGRQLAMNWHVKMDHEREHFYIQSGEGPPERRRRTTPSLDFEMDTSPNVIAYAKLSSRHSSLL